MVNNLIEKKIPSLDGLRAVSILMVVISHAANTFGFPRWQWLSKSSITRHSETGVTMFFVISGFLITTLLLNEKYSNCGRVDIKRFYIRRSLRILPVCYLFICLLFFSNQLFNFQIRGALFLYALTYTMNFGVNGVWMTGHLWSLAVEEQFYIFWPWVTGLSLKKVVILAFLIVVYAPLARVTVHLYPTLKFKIIAPFFTFADSLMIGCLLAISRKVYPSLWESSLLRNRFLRFISILILIVMAVPHPSGYYISVITLPFGRTIVSLSCAFFLASAITFKESHTFKFLNSPVIVYIGVLSYSIYIWQQPFLMPYNPESQFVWWFQVFPINIILVFLVSGVSYNFWEKGFLRIKDKFKAVAV